MLTRSLGDWAVLQEESDVAVAGELVDCFLGFLPRFFAPESDAGFAPACDGVELGGGVDSFPLVSCTLATGAGEGGEGAGVEEVGLAAVSGDGAITAGEVETSVAAVVAVLAVTDWVEVWRDSETAREVCFG